MIGVGQDKLSAFRFHLRRRQSFNRAFCGAKDKIRGLYRAVGADKLSASGIFMGVCYFEIEHGVCL